MGVCIATSVGWTYSQMLESILIPSNKPLKALKGEDLFAVEVANFLRELSMEAPYFVWFHVPNENTASFAYRLKQRWMGLIPGAPDFVIIAPNLTIFLELKVGKGKLSKSQKIFKKWCDLVKIPYFVCYDFDQAQTIITEFMDQYVYE